MSALITLAMLVAVTAQTPRSADDNRNLAPAVGTGGTIGGPTGLFTVYDGATLRRGEYTFSAAYSNFDRDPGDVDITEVPISFQIGLNDYIELFFNTDAYRQVKVNSFRNLSSFYTPNSQFFNSTLGRVAQPGAIVLAPQGATTTNFANTAVYRRAGAPFTQYPFVGGSFGNNGITAPPGVTLGSAFGFPAGTTPTLGAPISTGDGAALFPGYGSVYGSILPGVVLTTQSITLGANGTTTTAPLAYSAAPSYLPDAPFINRSYGQTAFNTFTVGGKIRFTGPDSPYGIGIIPFYRFYADKADDFAGFNQLQRGASPGGNRGDFGAIGFADARLRQWLNVSVNVGYIYNSDVNAEFPSGKFTILDRPDELLYGAALDFPVNKYFQPIAEFRGTRYVGGRTPNAFENHPMDALAGVRIFPRRWFGMGFAYRYNINQQDEDALEDTTFSSSVNVVTPTGGLVVNNSTNRTAALGPDAFRRSSDPHGFIGQFFIGRRNSRGIPPPVNQVPNVTALNLDSTTVTVPCPPGSESTSGGCKDDASIGVSTVAVDPENDVLTYNYTVSGGRIVGSGANVSWDLTGVQPGTYTITSAVDDGCGVCGTTQTKTVTVATCTDCKPICACPTLSVSGPSSAIRTGDAATFTATVSGGSQTNVTYNWTVSGGSITSGQGTPSITVDTAGLTGQEITATVEIGGDVCAECIKTASSSATIEVPPPSTPNKVDEFGALQNDDIKARLDQYSIQLQNDPASTGTVINYGTPAQVRRREALMRTYLTRNRGVDASRLNFVNGGTGDIKTELWVVPAGAPQPTPGM